MKIDFFLASMVLVLLGNAVYLFFSKNAKKKASLNRYYPLISVILFILSVIGLSFYYSSKLGSEQAKFNELLSKRINENIVLNEQRNRALDSLNTYRQQLETAIKSFKKKAYIAGDESQTLDRAKTLLNQTSDLIDKVQSYNEVVGRDTLSLLKTYYVDHNVFFANFQCPKDTVSEFLEIQFNLNPAQVASIGYIRVDVVRFDSAFHYTQIFAQGYRPKAGLNRISIQNHLKKPNMELQFGYLLKAELNKKTPTINQITCKSIVKPF